MSLNPDDLALYHRLLVENYCIVATSVLLFYDHAITLGDEVQRIWQRKFTGAAVVYLLTRYVATFERITLLTSLFLTTSVNQRCAPVLRLDDALNDISIFINGFFFCLRIYAIYGMDWRPAAPLFLVALALTAISMFFQISYTPVAFGPPLNGCGSVFHLTNNVYTRLSTASSALQLTADTLVLILTWCKTLEIRKGSSRSGIRTPLATLILRDGTLYFLVVLFIEVFAIVSEQAGSNFALFESWTYFNQSFTVMALSRFMLNLRGVYISRTTLPTDFDIFIPNETSDLQPVSYVVGNLGAPLDVDSAIATDHSTRVGYSADDDSSYSDVLVVPRDPLSADLPQASR